MKASACAVAALFALGLASSARADYPPPYPYAYPAPYAPRCAPTLCGSAYFAVNPYGAVYGPNYYVRPPCPPFNGLLPLLQPYPCAATAASRQQARPAPAFCGPMARSPRDFFMYGQTSNDF